MKKLSMITLFLTVIFLLAGCQGNISDLIDQTSEKGTLTGNVSYVGSLNIGIENTVVALVEELPQSFSEAENMSIEDLTYKVEVDSNGDYVISDIEEGEYYVLAFKDINGSGDIEFTDVSYGDFIPLDATGVYVGDSQEPATINISADTTTSEIDINLEDPEETTITDLTINVFAPTESSETPLNNASVSVYGKNSSNPLYTGNTNSSGEFTVNGIFGGEYYIEVTTSNHIDTLTAIYPIHDLANGGILDISIALLTDSLIDSLFGVYDNDECLILAVENYDPLDSSTDLSGLSILTTPSIADNKIGYLPTQNPFTSSLDFSRDAFPTYDPIEDDTLFMVGIKNIEAGNYNFALDIAGDEGVNVKAKTGKLVLIDPPDSNDY